jgi:hypothetical protein
MVAVLLLLLHTPPPDKGSESKLVLPSQTVSGPAMVPAAALTVTTVVTRHPFGNVYEIVEYPALTPNTKPRPGETPAAAGLPVLQVPPAGPDVSVVVYPTHTEETPDIGFGDWLTVTIAADTQPPEC